MKALKEIAHLVDLLAAERAEEVYQYEALLKETTLGERRQQGLTWYPIVINKQEIEVGDQLVLEIERTSHQDESHRFRQGQTAALFCNAFEGKERLTWQGVIKKIRHNTLHLVVKNEEVPDWLKEGKLGIDLLYNESTYKEMDIALKKLLSAKKERLAELRDVLLGYKKPSINYAEGHIDYAQLNASQNKALRQIDRAEDIAIIHGPPGTGKTTTLVRAIVYTLKSEKQVLVTAPSNTAVDLLTQKLLDEGVSVVRLGHPARINDKLQEHTLDSLVSSHNDYKPLKQLRRDALKLRQKALKFKRVFGREEREERKAALAEVKDMFAYARNLERYIVQHVLDKAQVITGTLVASSGSAIRDRIFSTVFIDEAAQALEPATWIPITRAKRVVLAGDHQQLPPTVKSTIGQREGLMESLFEKCIKRLDVAVMLDTQYRSHEKIMAFSSRYFYNKQLHAHASVASNILGNANSDPLLREPFDYIDTAGCGFTEALNMRTLSLKNPKEGELLLKYIASIVSQMENEQLAFGHLTIGIIAPYKEQVLLLRRLLEDYPVLWAIKEQIAIHTVDGFQGQERDIIGISLVRSNDKGEIGFLSDIRRTNVAMTRAKRKLVMIGDSATLGGHRFYQDLLQYIDEIEAYKSAWEFMY